MNTLIPTYLRLMTGPVGMPFAKRCACTGLRLLGALILIFTILTGAQDLLGEVFSWFGIDMQSRSNFAGTAFHYCQSVTWFYVLHCAVSVFGGMALILYAAHAQTVGACAAALMMSVLFFQLIVGSVGGPVFLVPNLDTAEDWVGPFCVTLHDL